MIGIPFHSEAGFPSETVSVSGSEGFAGVSEETGGNFNVGIAVELGCAGLEQAAKTSRSSSQQAAMDFFTRPSLQNVVIIITDVI